MNKDLYPVIMALIAGGSAIAGSLGGVMLQNRNTENSELEKRKTITFNKVINSDEKGGLAEQIEKAINSGLLPDPDNKILSAIKEKSSKIDCGLSVELSKFTYPFGEKIDLQVSTKQSCYLLIISMDTKGEISKLYPSSYEESKKKVHNINFLNDSSPIIASPPEGANIIFLWHQHKKLL